MRIENTALTGFKPFHKFLQLNEMHPRFDNGLEK